MNRLVCSLGLAAVLAIAATPAYATSISVLVGDKDGFGQGLLPGQSLPCVTQTIPCLSPVQDWRDATEKLATNGAQFTDLYSALYDGTEWDCTDPQTGAASNCSPNGATGTVIFPFVGTLSTASITMLLGDFQSTAFNPMLATINGIPVSFFFEDGYRNTALHTITLTPAMIAAANAIGQVQLFLDHRTTCPSGSTCGSFDYVAFDYLELNANAVPEPGTLALLATGLAALAARRRARI